MLRREILEGPSTDEVLDQLQLLHDREKDLQETRLAWEAFKMGIDPKHPLRQTVLMLQVHSKDLGVDPDITVPGFRRVSASELQARETRYQPLIEKARGHMRWVRSLLMDVPHVIYLVCRDAVVLCAETNDLDLLDDWNLGPGADRSEAAMGTNGAGTALRKDRPVVTFGTEHYLHPFKNSVCLASPIHSPGGGLAGAINLTTTVADVKPQRLAVLSYSAAMIERDLVTAKDVAREVPTASDGRTQPDSTSSP